jgi:hypothetical protein
MPEGRLSNNPQPKTTGAGHAPVGYGILLLNDSIAETEIGA